MSHHCQKFNHHLYWRFLYPIFWKFLPFIKIRMAGGSNPLVIGDWNRGYCRHFRRIDFSYCNTSCIKHLNISFRLSTCCSSSVCVPLYVDEQNIHRMYHGRTHQTFLCDICEWELQETDPNVGRV